MAKRVVLALRGRPTSFSPLGYRAKASTAGELESIMRQVVRRGSTLGSGWDRFWASVEFSPGSCWLWRGHTTTNGYGVTTFNGKHYPAHRVAYMLSRGDIPSGLVLDHLCREPLCVNPIHLEAVTQRENTVRGVGIVAKRAAATMCGKGLHLFSGENVRTSKRGRRVCAPCEREYNRIHNPINAALRKKIA